MEFTCETCRTKGRAGNVKTINVSCLVGDMLITLPVRVCLTIECVAEHGGSATKNVTGPGPGNKKVA